MEDELNINRYDANMNGLSGFCQQCINPLNKGIHTCKPLHQQNISVPSYQESQMGQLFKKSDAFTIDRLDKLLALSKEDRDRLLKFLGA